MPHATVRLRPASKVHPLDRWCCAPTASIMEDMIDVDHVSKRYGEKLAVDDLTFTVQPGIVTGFLGPNGAGQVDHDADDRSASTRRPRARARSTAGAYRDLAGAAARGRRDARGARHPHRPLAPTTTCWRWRRRTASRAPASTRSSSSSASQAVARKRAGGFSLGMGQRLGIASALLGDPATLDPRRAGQRPGPRGHPVDPQPAQGPGRRGPHGLPLLAPDERDRADGRAPDRRRARPADRRHDRRGGRRAGLRRTRPCACARPQATRAARRARGRRRRRSTQRRARRARGPRPASERIGEIAARAAASSCTSSTPQQASLEEAFMRLTGDAVEYHARTPTRPEPTGAGRHERRRRRRPRRPRARHAGATVVALGVDQAVDAALDALVAAGRRRRDGRRSGILVAAVQMSRWTHLEPHERAPLRLDRHRRRRLPPRPARDRRPRRAGDQRRVLDRA